MVYLYATDLKKEYQNDTFMGEGFEKAFQKSIDNETQLIIGEYFENSDWREE